MTAVNITLGQYIFYALSRVCARVLKRKRKTKFPEAAGSLPVTLAGVLCGSCVQGCYAVSGY